MRMRRDLVARLDQGDVGGLVSTVAEIRLAVLAIDAAAAEAVRDSLPIDDGKPATERQSGQYWRNAPRTAKARATLNARQ